MPKGPRLDANKIARLNYVGAKNKQCIYWDQTLPGFGVRVYPSGAKRFIVSYRWDKKKRIAVIGDAVTMPVRVARKSAREYLLAQQNIYKRLILKTTEAFQKRDALIKATRSNREHLERLYRQENSQPVP